MRVQSGPVTNGIRMIFPRMARILSNAMFAVVHAKLDHPDDDDEGLAGRSMRPMLPGNRNGRYFPCMRPGARWILQ